MSYEDFMNFEEDDIVKVITTPTYPNEHLDQRIGYIDSIPQRKKDDLQQHYLVNILAEDGIECSALIAEAYLALDTSNTGKRLYTAHQEKLDSITASYNEHQRQYRTVINHLAVKYGIAPDEIRGIYNAVLCFDDYYRENNL